MNLSHRHAEEKDLNAVFELYMDPASNPFLTFDPMPVQNFFSVFKQMIEDETLFVCELENEVVATYRLVPKTHRQSHILYLGGLSIKSTAKGKGFGFALLEHIKSTVKMRGISRIELTVDTENVRAINLYRKVGFEIEGKLKNNYRLASTGNYYDEYLMALLLH